MMKLTHINNGSPYVLAVIKTCSLVRICVFFKLTDLGVGMA